MAFVMDPLDRIDIDKDTTFAFMLAAQERGHEVLFLHARDLAYGGHDVGAAGRSCDSPTETATTMMAAMAPSMYCLRCFAFLTDSGR